MFPSRARKEVRDDPSAHNFGYNLLRSRDREGADHARGESYRGAALPWPIRNFQ